MSNQNPPDEPTKITIRLPQSMVNEVKHLLIDEGGTMQSLIETLLQGYLSNSRKKRGRA